MVLADTSIWVDHLRRGRPDLSALLTEGKVACHPFLIGELACGNLSHRQEILSLLKTLPASSRVDDDEIIHFIERHRLIGSGIGIVDAHLLASSWVSGFPLWTSDKRLRGAALSLDCAYRPEL
ncbi:MAG: type II toxin-antitoxin system VapC family toxin [Burkholderiales bacterium]